MAGEGRRWYDFAARIVPAIPERWQDIKDEKDNVALTAAQVFAREMELIAVRREIENHTANILKALATNRQLRGEVARLQRRLDQEEIADGLARQAIAGQRDVILEDIEFNLVQIRRWKIERRMFVALVWSEEK